MGCVPSGYHTYCHYLKIEVSQSHPVMKAFCLLLLQLARPEGLPGLRASNVEEGEPFPLPSRGVHGRRRGVALGSALWICHSSRDAGGALGLRVVALVPSPFLCHLCLVCGHLHPSSCSCVSVCAKAGWGSSAFAPGCRWHLGGPSEGELELKSFSPLPSPFRHPADAAQEGTSEQSQVQAEPSPLVAGLHAPQ